MKIGRIEFKDFRGIVYACLDLKSDGLTQITGKNGAGKSSFVSFLKWILMGPTSTESKQQKTALVHAGASKASGRTILTDPELGEYEIIREITAGGYHDLIITNKANGEIVRNQQAWLDAQISHFSFDPLSFAQMKPGEQVEALKQVIAADLDLEGLAEADEEDIKQRALQGRERDQFKSQQAAINTDALLDLPGSKIDEAAIYAKLNAASEAQRQARELDRAKQELGTAAANIGMQKIEARRRIERKAEDITRLEDELKKAREDHKRLATEEKEIEKRHKAAEKTWQDAPAGQDVDVAAISQELQDARRTNEYIDLLALYNHLEKQAQEKQRLWEAADDRIKSRAKLRAEALAKTKLPVEGLTYVDEGVKSPRTGVYYQAPGKSRPLPLANYGEGEQIRISTMLGIALHPRLQVMCIDRGEALDEDGLAIIEQLAKEHKFQILMARREESGNIGVFIENGKIKKINGKLVEDNNVAKAMIMPIRK